MFISRPPQSCVSALPDLAIAVTTGEAARCLRSLSVLPTLPDGEPNRTRCVNSPSGREGSGADSLLPAGMDGLPSRYMAEPAVTPVVYHLPRGIGKHTSADIRVTTTSTPLPCHPTIACMYVASPCRLSPLYSTNMHGGLRPTKQIHCSWTPRSTPTRTSSPSETTSGI
jgi:hypothetical protein